MSNSQFHCTGRVYLDLHGLIFETSICYWQDQPGSPLQRAGGRAGAHAPRRAGGFCAGRPATGVPVGGGARRFNNKKKTCPRARAVLEVSRNAVFARDPPPKAP